jgi:hypothetical protein
MRLDPDTIKRLIAEGKLPKDAVARASKYHNQPQVVDGIRFDSAREARRWCELQTLERAGEIRELRRQVEYPIEVNGVRVCYYVADFVYRTPDGKTVVEDAKGLRTPVYALKCKLMRAAYGVEIKEV